MDRRMNRRPGRRLSLWLAAVLAAVPACRLTDLPLWRAPEPAPGTAWPVDVRRDVVYYDGPGADPDLHRLDLFLPRGARDYPVVLLVHGGAWMLGDNRCCGLYSSVGEFLAGQGIGVAMPRYRLAPNHTHPAQVRDIARAFAWLHRHAATYGGSPDRLFLVGHSAGGHLVSLLATDEQYLRAEGLRRSAVRGVVSVSGVYRIPAGPLDVRLGGNTALAFRLDELVPLRGMIDYPLLGPGFPLRLNVFGPIFGDDPRVRAAASPVNHVCPGLPPFLILHAEKELPWLTAMAEEFHAALLEQGCDSYLARIAGRNHQSIVFAAVDPGDPVGGAITAFVRQYAGPGLAQDRGGRLRP
jgi:acetyl esterase/lipase